MQRLTIALLITLCSACFCSAAPTELYPVYYPRRTQDQQGTRGYVNASGELVIRGFEDTDHFSEGLAAVELKNEEGEKYWAYIDEVGRIAIQGPFVRATPFVNGLAVVQRHDIREDKYEYIDKKGKNPFGRTFDRATPFVDSMALVQEFDSGTDHVFIDRAGNPLFPTLMEKYVIKFASPGYDGRPVVSVKYARGGSTRLAGYITDKAGTLKSFGEDINYRLSPRREGLAYYEKTGMLWTSVKHNGYLGPDLDPEKLVIDCTGRYEGCQPFSEGLAAVKEPGADRWGYIDKTGKLVIPFRAAEEWDYPRSSRIGPPARPFKEGMAAIRLDYQNVQIIDRGGNVVATGRHRVDTYDYGIMTRDFRYNLGHSFPSAFRTSEFRGGLASLGSGKVIDKTGRVIYDEDTYTGPVFPTGGSAPATSTGPGPATPPAGGEMKPPVPKKPEPRPFHRPPEPTPEKPAPPPSAPTPPPPAPAPAPGRITCPQCGWNATGNFCTDCGARLRGEEATDARAPSAPEDTTTAVPLSAEDAEIQYVRGVAAKKAKDYDTAWKLLFPVAKQGHVEAQSSVGTMLYHGQGVAMDRAAAASWFRKAAEKGDTRAKHNLAYSLRKGIGVPKDEAEALEWYRDAASQGYALAQLDLSYMYENGIGTSANQAKAVEWCRKSAKQGNAIAQNNLAHYYASGNGVAVNKSAAVTWYRKAAERGRANAQYNLGLCLANGTGIRVNKAAAARWYRKAAEQGYAHAQNNLAQCYMKGEGVPRNRAEAIRLYRLAAAQGNKAAKNNLADVLENED